MPRPRIVLTAGLDGTQRGDSEENLVDFAALTGRSLLLVAARLTKTESHLPQTVTSRISLAAAATCGSLDRQHRGASITAAV